jgi:uncharacterized membrane protein YccF (DUF307 family)
MALVRFNKKNKRKSGYVRHSPPDIFYLFILGIFMECFQYLFMTGVSISDIVAIQLARDSLFAKPKGKISPYGNRAVTKTNCL